MNLKRYGIKERVCSLPNKLIDFVYPSYSYCISCGAYIDEHMTYSLCTSCNTKFKWISNEDKCDKCGKKLSLSEQAAKTVIDMLCSECKKQERYFDKGFTCMVYGLYERNLVSAFKERGQAHVGEHISQMLYDRIVIENLSLDVIIAVPIHRTKQRKRGFNQSEILAKNLAKKLGVVFDSDIIMRRRKTKSMKLLDRHQRAENVKDAFVVRDRYRDKLEGKAILIVDDVYTTGATLNEISKVLRVCKPCKIYTLTFAAGMGHNI